MADADPDRLARVAPVVWQAGAPLWRGHRHHNDPVELVTGGDTRFAPLPDTGHTYVSATATAALLESALHSLSGPEPTIYSVELARWCVSPVVLAADVALADLRDDALAGLGVTRQALVDTDPLHYRCTRRWAADLRGRVLGGHQTGGAVWHSRQADLHARAHPDGLLADLLVHRSVEVAVLWHPPALAAPLVVTGPPEPLWDDAGPARLVAELAALLRAPVE